MKRSDDHSQSSDSIRSEINQTRDRMDHTIDALSDRLKGRHLVDEVLGFLRSSDASRQLKDKILDSTSSAVHSLVSTVKAHPAPMLVLGAGLAWLTYEKHEEEHAPGRRDYDGDDGIRTARTGWREAQEDGDVAGVQSAGFEDEPNPDEHSGGARDTIRDKAAEIRHDVRDKSAELKGRAREGLHRTRERARDGLEHARERASEGLAQARERASEAGAHLRDQTRHFARRTRDQVVDTTQRHPLESGASLLALGLIAGLLTPTPRKLEEAVGPTSQRVRQRVRAAGADLVERGRHVVQAASEAAHEEAEAQGLTPEMIAERARQAGQSGSESNAATPSEPQTSAGAAAGPGENTCASAEPLIADQPDSPDFVERCAPRSPAHPESPP